MSAFEVVQRYGAWVLVRFALGLLAFVVLHVMRMPLLVAARVLEVCMRRIDGFVLAGLPSRPPAGAASGQEGGR